MPHYLEKSVREFGDDARAVALHLAETMMAKPIEEAGRYFSASSEEIKSARLAVARKCQADYAFAVKLAQCKVDVLKVAGRSGND